MDPNAVVWGVRLVWWLVIGAVLLGFVVLALSAVPVLRRLRRLRGAGERLRRQGAAADLVQARALELQHRSEQLAAQAGRVQARMAAISGRDNQT